MNYTSSLQHRPLSLQRVLSSIVFYDLEKDLINRPHKALFDRIVSKSFCLNTYFVLNAIGLAFAFFASWRVFLFSSRSVLVCGFTHTNYRSFPLSESLRHPYFLCWQFLALCCITNISTGLCCCMVASFMSLLMNRENIKNLKNIDGDIAVGNRSISTKWGEKVSKNIFGTISVVMVGLLLCFYQRQSVTM